MGWLLLVGVVIIASRPGVKPPACIFPISFWKKKTDFSRFWGRKKSPYFDYPTMLGASGGLAPSFYWSPAFLKNPQKVTVIEDFVFFPEKKVGRKWPFCPRAPMSTGAGPGAGGRNLWLSVSGVFFFFFLEFYVFYQKKYRF